MKKFTVCLYDADKSKKVNFIVTPPTGTMAAAKKAVRKWAEKCGVYQKGLYILRVRPYVEGDQHGYEG